MPKKNEIANISDALNLPNLTEAELMRMITERYAAQRIYTFVGPKIVIAMNPFKDFKGAPQAFEKMYGPENQARYKPTSHPENDPHVFSIGANALRQLTAHKKSQSILITGESGSGKTESTKKLLKYFADQDGAMSGITQSTNVEGSLEMKLSNMNFILEAFGNSVTSRNHNSSRFGKWIELNYDRHRNLKHAEIKTYVLETSRVIHHNQAERNYHIFYRMFNKSAQEHSVLLRELVQEFLGHCSTFNIKPLESEYVGPHVVGKADPWENNSMKKNLVKKDDDEEGAEMAISFAKYKFSDEQTSHIYKMILGIILLGSIKYELASDGSSGQLTAESQKLIPTISDYFGFNAKDLADYLTKWSVRNEDYPASMSKCQASLSTLSKTLYDRLFIWIVKFLNGTLNEGKTRQEDDRFVGLLDIAGFEHFEVNGLDQLLINYNNENLQNAFNQEFIQREMDTYEREGVLSLANEFRERFALKNNRVIIDLISGTKKPKVEGVLSVLVDTMRAPGKDEEKDGKFVKNLLSKPAICDHSKFQRPKFGTDTFTIVHYADSVEYGVTDGWVDKIKLSISSLFERAVKNSSNVYLKEMFDGITTDTKQTLVDVYLKDINGLMDEIDSTDRQYVRCIKPNKAMTYANGVDHEEARLQLACSGVMEAVEIRVQGYGFRENYREMVMTFAEILSDETKKLKRGEPTTGEKLREKYLGMPDAVPVDETKMIFKKALQQVKGDSHLENLLQEANMGFGKTMLFCRIDPRPALHKALDCNLKARCERRVFAIRLASAYRWYKDREARLTRERSARIFEDCLKWKLASDKAQKRVPDIPGGLFLYPKSIIGGVKTGGQLIKSAAMFNTLIKALVKLDQEEHVKHIESFKAIARRMVCEGNCIIRAESWVADKRPAAKFSIPEYQQIYALIQEAKSHSIYNPVFDELNKVAAEIKIVYKGDKRLKEAPKRVSTAI